MTRGGNGDGSAIFERMIDSANRRRFLMLVGKATTRMIRRESLAGRFANGGPFQYRSKRYAAMKKQAGRFRGHVDFFGFSNLKTLDSMSTAADHNRFVISLKGDAAMKTRAWQHRYHWFSFGGKRQAEVGKIAERALMAIDWL